MASPVQDVSCRSPGLILPTSINRCVPRPQSPDEKKRAIARLRRIRGQVDGLERAIEAGSDCGPVLQQIAALRGAVNGLMAGILDSHLREEFTQVATDPKIRKQHQASIDEVVALVRSYLK